MECPGVKKKKKEWLLHLKQIAVLFIYLFTYCLYIWLLTAITDEWSYSWLSVKHFCDCHICRLLLITGSHAESLSDACCFETFSLLRHEYHIYAYGNVQCIGEKQRCGFPSHAWPFCIHVRLSS